MKILNTTKGDLAVAPGHVVPAMGSADIPEDVLEKVQNSKVVEAWVKDGKLTLEGEIDFEEQANEDAVDKVKAAAKKTKPAAKSKERKELEAQAKELELEFTDETSDEDLKKAVEAALNA